MSSQLVRDIRLGIAMGEYNITIDDSKFPGRWYFFLNRKRKMVLDIFKLGGVLIGSRALVLYKVNGVKVLNRDPDDWDFIMTREQFLLLCKKYEIYNVDLNSTEYHLQKSMAHFSDGYGHDSHVFKCLVHIIIKDELPEFTEINGKRYASFDSIVSAKIDLVSDFKTNDRAKHECDINNIFLNVYNIEKNEVLIPSVLIFSF